ncbi:MAG TPA: alpha/beta hydrolase domain-containing protein, partial [Acidimicrobiales bacterium]|nr:alpha/beta hydrolase domain-containing protein [Acidimicrobiales bacterium]
MATALAVLAAFVGGLVAAAFPSVTPATAAVAAAGNPHVPSPTVQGPILPTSGISFLGSTLFPLSKVGYEESEFFLSGTATAYTTKTALTKDGKWHVTAAGTAPYTTRVVVYRPVDAKKFDGTVDVEWLNVTGGVDAAAAWLTGHPEEVRAGVVYIGVDAQVGGINGVPGSVASAEAGAGGLKQSDPTRYAALNHPGDSYSFSIFEQAGEAVHTSAPKLLSGLVPKRVLAIGESQSAFYLTTYLDAIQPLSTGVYNGYLVYSRGNDGANLSQSPQPDITTPNPTYIRTDLHVPVMLFETEADLLLLGYVEARQAPTPYIREWETAGTAHDDTYGLLYSRSDDLTGQADTQ